MRKTTNILQVPFDVVTMQEAVKRCMEFFQDEGQHIICTPNPEIVMEAQQDRELLEILRAADLVVPDGVGVVWASKYSKYRLPERVSGFDLAMHLFEAMKNTGYTAYLFGGAPGVAAAAAKQMTKKFAPLQIVGVHNGYFTQKEEKDILADIKKKKPSLLLVGLGSPKQEKWIYDNMRFTGASVCIGVGGSFDVMAGTVKRAPKGYQKLGLEWLYRLLKQPARIKRMGKLPKFVLAVWKARKKHQ